jgi:hypothetical protein
MAFPAFVFDAAYHRGDSFAFGFLRLGIAVGDGVLPVGGINGSTVSSGSFYPRR